MSCKNRASILTKLISVRQQFYKAQKSSDESPHDWLIRLKELSKACCFRRNSDIIVLDKFITELEPEIIDYLCLSAEIVNLKSAMDIIRAFQSQKADPQLVLSSSDESSHFPAKTETVFSEILIKAEKTNNKYALDSDHSVEDTFNADTMDTIEPDDEEEEEIEEAEIVDIGNTSPDGDVLCNKFENILPEKIEPVKKEVKKESKNVKKTKTKTKNNVDAIENSVKTEEGPNEPKPKRKYKKRAIKEKQTFQCDICNYTVSHECHLRRHKLIHLDQKSFICHMCGKGFNLNINLNQHIRRHLGYKPHSCEICKASFIDKTRLRLHMRVHTGERPFTCEYCQKSFSDRYYMKVHMRLHTGERPFRCEICQRTFSQSSSLSVHKKSCSLRYNGNQSIESQIHF